MLALPSAPAPLTTNAARSQIPRSGTQQWLEVRRRRSRSRRCAPTLAVATPPLCVARPRAPGRLKLPPRRCVFAGIQAQWWRVGEASYRIPGAEGRRHAAPFPPRDRGARNCLHADPERGPQSKPGLAFAEQWGAAGGQATADLTRAVCCIEWKLCHSPLLVAVPLPEVSCANAQRPLRKPWATA